MVDRRAPIVPAHGLGGISLRTPVRELDALLRGLGSETPGRFLLASLYEARYVLASDSMEVAVDVRTSEVFRLTASQGYDGALFEKIRVGMTVAEARDFDSRIFYHEGEELVLVRGVPGVSLQFDEPDPPPSVVQSLRISGISVFIREIDTAAAQRGEW